MVVLVIDFFIWRICVHIFLTYFAYIYIFIFMKKEKYEKAIHNIKKVRKIKN